MQQALIKMKPATKIIGSDENENATAPIFNELQREKLLNKWFLSEWEISKMQQIFRVLIGHCQKETDYWAKVNKSSMQGIQNCYIGNATLLIDLVFLNEHKNNFNEDFFVMKYHINVRNIVHLIFLKIFRTIGLKKHIMFVEEQIFYVLERKSTNNGCSDDTATCWIAGCFKSFCKRWNRLFSRFYNKNRAQNWKALNIVFHISNSMRLA